MNKRTAVVLLNLGGPDTANAVKPFLINLFSDPAILRVPGWVRWLLARLIAFRRTSKAKEIYRQIGGSSPILGETESQASALQSALTGPEYKVFISMRYWHPFSHEVVSEVKVWDPTEVILLPLYPQFSTTTTDSSVRDWLVSAREQNLDVLTRVICCYPVLSGLVREHVRLLRNTLKKVPSSAEVRVLFSAHGLPKRIVQDGDPYVWQVEQTASEIAKAAELDASQWRLCYQSKVTPVEWVGPSTEDEIIAAARDGLALVVVPIAFVSEHSETLVELDIEYADLAKKVGITNYERVPALGNGSMFIAGLKEMVVDALNEPTNVGTCSANGSRICQKEHTGCPMKNVSEETHLQPNASSH